MRRLTSRTAIALSCLIVAAGSVAWAQNEERESCVDACDETKAQCIDICDTRPNPIECEETCQEDAQDCTYNCR